MSMPYRVFACLIAVLVIASAFALPFVAEAERYNVGPKKCQECHRAEFRVWEGTKHFKSFREVHRSDKAKKILDAVGGSPNMKKNEVCTLCHYTLVQKSEGARPVARAGPSCESCHGAASEWMPIHGDYGGPAAKRETESKEHRSERIKASYRAGLVWPFLRYDIAMNCMSCHGLARKGLKPEILAKMLAAEHPLKPEFEFVRYSQGTVRHRFYPPNLTVNAPMTPAQLSRAFVEGQAARLLSAARVLAGAKDAKFIAAQKERYSRAREALAALKSVPEAAAFIAKPGAEAARALIKAIRGKDLSAEVSRFLPDPKTYK